MRMKYRYEMFIEHPETDDRVYICGLSNMEMATTIAKSLLADAVDRLNLQVYELRLHEVDTIKVYDYVEGEWKRIKFY